MKSNIPILLTATIRPHASPGLYNVRQTERERFNQYCAALAYLAKCGRFKRIVFAENSSSSLLAELKEVVCSLERKGPRIELFHDPLEDEALVQGKGYGEGWLISRAVEQSAILQDADSFVKLTGRYKLRNLYRMFPPIERVAASQPSPDFVCQGLRRYDGTIPIVSTAFFWCTTQAWTRCFSDAYQEVNDRGGWAFEAEVAKRLRDMVSAGRRVGEVPLPLIVDAMNTKDNRPMLSRKELYWLQMKSVGGHLLRPHRVIRILKPSDF